MAKSRIKPKFGREMDPCEYKSKWANKLSRDEVVVIRAENNKSREASRGENR